MGFIQSILGLKSEDTTWWIEHDIMPWDYIGEDSEGNGYHVQKFSPHQSPRGAYWWKMKITHPGNHAMDVSICHGNPEKPVILIPIVQRVSVNGQKPLSKPLYKQIIDADEHPINLCLELAEKAPPFGLAPEPPYVTYGMSLLLKFSR